MASLPDWLAAALEHQRAGRFAEVERICERVLGANPAEADALHLLGLIAASRDQHERAGTMFARAITYKPNPDIWLKGEYRYDQLRSSAPGVDYSSNAFLVGLKLQR